MKAQRLEELPDLLTVQEVTGFLRVSRNTVYDALRAGTVPSIKMGRRILIPKEGLRQMLEQCVNQSKSQGIIDHADGKMAPLLLQVKGNGPRE